MSRVLQIVIVLFVFALVAAVPLMFGAAVYTPVEGASAPDFNTQVVEGFQEITVRGEPNGYAPASFTVKKGVPVKLRFSADKFSGCGQQLIMRDFGVDLVALNGETREAVFTPTQEGVYPYRCSMNMFRGQMVVTA